MKRLTLLVAVFFLSVAPAYGAITVDDLQEIHAKYMKLIVPEWQFEKTLFGSKGEPKEKEWQVLLDGGSGDCDDYAETFRAAVIMKDLGAKVWRYAGVRFGGYHAVTVVEIDGVKYLMDNTRAGVVVLDQKFYNWTHTWKNDAEGWRKYKAR